MKVMNYGRHVKFLNRIDFDIERFFAWPSNKEINDMGHSVTGIGNSG